MGQGEMQMVEFLTVDDMSKSAHERKATVWCRTNRRDTFRDFIQYVLDSLEHPEDFMLLDVKKGVVYDMYRLATEQFGMRKRTFRERMDNMPTGIWTGNINAA